MARRKNNQLKLDEFSAQLEQMVAVDKPKPTREETELVLAVRKHYELLKQAIVERHYSYVDVSKLLVQCGLKKGASPPSVKAALVKVAEEKGEAWNYGRGGTGQGDQSETTNTEESETVADSPKPESPKIAPSSNNSKAQKLPISSNSVEAAY